MNAGITAGVFGKSFGGFGYEAHNGQNGLIIPALIG
jgi:hypothetical protein